MVARLQNASRRAGLSICRARLWVFLCLLFVVPRPSSAQTPAWTVARITGDDISISGAGGDVSPQDQRTIFLASGSEITVHSGQARLELINGGVIGICGPARLKLLESTGAFTVAMDFGRLHISLDGATPLTVYTPLVLAVPQGISGGPREATIGLDANGAMCARAARGGVRLQQQFTGEIIVVPEPEEMFVSGGQFRAAAGAPGACQCEILQARAAQPVVPAVRTEKTTANIPPPTLPPAKQPAKVARGEYSVPAKAAETKPAEKPAEKKAAANHGTTEAPVWKVLMPPLVFDASSPNPPSVPSPEMILLVREVRVEPDWVFRGRVAPRSEPRPPRPTLLPVALSNARPADATAQTKTQKKKNDFGKRHGLFQRIFGGGSPCAGVGCGS